MSSQRSVIVDGGDGPSTRVRPTSLSERDKVVRRGEFRLFIVEEATHVRLGLIEEECIRDCAGQPESARGEARDVAGRCAVAQGGGRSEEAEAPQVRPRSGLAFSQCKSIVEIGVLGQSG